MIDPSAIRLIAPAAMGLVLALALPAQVSGKAQPVSGSPVSRTAAAGKQAPQPRRRPEFPIAVVDVGKAASHTRAMKAGRLTMQKMRATYKQSLDALRKEIETLDVEISMMNNPTSDKMDQKIKLAALVRKHEAAEKYYKAALSRKRAETDSLVYRELESALAELAKRNGILLVLRKRAHQSTEEVVKQGGTAADALSRQVSTDRLRDVLFHAAAIDLTDDLIKYLKG